MPRISRNSLETSFFHIMVQGINKEYIFKEENYMEKYISFMYEKKEKFNIQILAYCIMHNHAHILIYTDKIEDMSEFMRSINTKYAQFYNLSEGRVGYVFKNRFKSESIENESYLLRCIRYIHNNPVKAGIVNHPRRYVYSSYNLYEQRKEMYNNKVLKELIDVNLIINDMTQEDILENVFIEVENNNNMKTIQTKLLELQLKAHITLNDFKQYKKMLVRFVEEIKEKYRIPYSDIVKEIGISTSTFKRIKKENKFI